MWERVSESYSSFQAVTRIQTQNASSCVTWKLSSLLVLVTTQTPNENYRMTWCVKKHKWASHCHSTPLLSVRRGEQAVGSFASKWNGFMNEMTSAEAQKIQWERLWRCQSNNKRSWRFRWMKTLWKINKRYKKAGASLAWPTSDSTLFSELCSSKLSVETIYDFWWCMKSPFWWL